MQQVITFIIYWITALLMIANLLGVAMTEA